MSDDPMSQAQQQIEFLRHRCDMEVMHIAELKEQIKVLRKERDEARREICSNVVFPSSPQDYATNRRGWDCFKQEDGE